MPPNDPPPQSRPTHSTPLVPRVGFIYDYPLSLEQVLLRVGVVHARGDGSKMSFSQQNSVRSVERRINQQGKKGRSKSRPCLVVQRSQVGNPEVVLLSTLDGYHPSLFCAIAQHYLIAVNETPAWPTKDSFRLDIKPEWPGGHSYVLAILCPATAPPLGQRTYQGGSYFVEDCLEILRHCDRIGRSARSWSAEKRNRMDETHRTHHLLRGKVLDLHTAHSPDDLKALNFYYNDHRRKLSLAQDTELPDDDCPIPADLIPENLRVYLNAESVLSAVRPFSFDYDPRTSAEIQFKQLSNIEAEVKSMGVALRAGQRSDEELLHLLRAIVTTAVETTTVVHHDGTTSTAVHPAFESADDSQLRELVTGDLDLRKVLLSVSFGFVSRANAILNYVCQENVSS